MHYTSTATATATGSEPPGSNLELYALSMLSRSLEKLLVDAEYDYTDAEIVVESNTVGVHRCILAARSPFFQELFNKGNDSAVSVTVKEGKPRYLLSQLVPYASVGHEAFMDFLNYLYTGKLRPSLPKVSKCVDHACCHHACHPAINYALELMYDSATFQIKELFILFQRRLINFVEKAFVEDVIPILVAAFHCQLIQLLSQCVQIVAQSDLDSISLENDLPQEVSGNIKSLRLKSQQEVKHSLVEVELVNEKTTRRIQRALDSDDIELVKLLLVESNITLDNAYALHYATAYCDPKVVSELLSLGMADLNLRDSRGYTVLHVAARRKDPSIIVGLLNKGASVSDTTLDGQTAVTICRRMTRPKDYNEATKKGQESNKDRLCIDVLEREMCRNPLAGNMSISSTVVADDLHMMLLLIENRVAVARLLFPREARLAMEIAHADSTSEFTDLSSSQGLSPFEKTKRLQLRLQALQKTEVLGKFLEDEMPDAFFLEKGIPEEQRIKKMRFMELEGCDEGI